jgi:acyl-ACP thioesterase
VVREVRRPRRVRLGDVTASGRLRLDALARYLQDIAWDDVADAGVSEGRWVVRRAALRLTELPRFGEEVELVTGCSGRGPRWAERRTVMTGARADVESVAVWVHLDEHGRPRALDPRFDAIWGDGLPRVSARLRLPGPPGVADRRPWQLRASDVDVLGHLNNAVALAGVEDEIARSMPGRRLVAADLEHRDPIDPGDDVVLASTAERDVLHVWLTVDGVARFAARVAFRPPVD